MSNWIVMPSIEPGRNNGVSFETNATGLDETAARTEADRRNAAEKAAGHVGVDWFPAQDPLALMAARMGISADPLRASLA
jgi:hypothetical protein